MPYLTVPISTQITIQNIADKIGMRAPKLTAFENCCAVSLRNGDGDKILVTIPWDDDEASIEHKLAAAFKVQAKNLPSEATLKRLHEQ